MGARAVNVAATARLWTCTWRPAGRSSRPLGSACFAPLDSLEVLGETVPGLCRALFHPGLEHAVAVLDGVVDGGGGERGLAVVLLEGQRLYRDVTGKPSHSKVHTMRSGRTISRNSPRNPCSSP